MSNVPEDLYALIFAGGGGTRLWPLSRDKKPKQFLRLFSHNTLLQQTFKRVGRIISSERIFVITTSLYKEEVARQLPEISSEQIIVEPVRKNTGPAAFLGLLAIKKINPQAIVANIWSDHKIDNTAGYGKALTIAAKAVSDGKHLATVGIQPSFPHTGLGYIKKGEKVEDGDGIAWRVAKFVEKPDVKSAEDMLDEGGYLWNVGLYVWRLDQALVAFSKYAPEISKFGEDFQQVVKLYDKMPEIPIDKAVSERAHNLLVVEGNFDWSDIGDFEVLWEKSPKKDDNGNAILIKDGGGWIGIDTQGGMFVSESGQTIATYGLENVVIVATKDAVLVVPKGEAQKVKELVIKIRESGKNEIL